jgi:hypothetical protein
MVEPRYNVVGACERIIAEASTLAGQNYAFNMQRKTGALDFITSPENAGVEVESGRLISSQGGRKAAKLHIYYDQRTKPCQISDDCDANVCNDGTTPVRQEMDVTISNCLSTPAREYTAADMAALCNDTETFMRTRGFNDLLAARQKLSERVTAYLDTEIGINYEFDGSTTPAGGYKPIQLLFSVNGQPIPQPGNWAYVLADYENNQLMGVPAVIGQGNFEIFAKLHGMSCCNATTPFGEANINGDARFYKEMTANQVLGPNKLIVTAFGVHHFLYWNENRNIAAVEGSNGSDAFHIVVPDPAGYPIDWNFDFYFDHCDKKWKSMYSIMWGAFNIFQADSFAASGEDTSPDVSPDCDDDLDGMLATFGYEATQGS